MKQTILVFLLAIGLCINSSAQCNDCTCYFPVGVHLPEGIHLMDNAEDWRLIFFDDFPGNEINHDLWNTYYSCGDPGETDQCESSRASADAMQIYTDDEVSVYDGICHLFLEGAPNGSYTWYNVTKKYKAGMIESRTDPNHSISPGRFERGKFEARIKFAYGAHWTHDCFWLWDGNGEIDIAEYYRWHGANGLGREVTHNIHNYYKDVINTDPRFNQDHEHGNTSINIPKGWHRYKVIWDKYYMYFYIDDVFKARESRFNFYNTNTPLSSTVYNNSQTQDGYYWLRNCFISLNAEPVIRLTNAIDKKDPFHSWMDLLIDQDAGIPSVMLVDWVKVYQRSECSDDDTIYSSALLPYNNLSTPNPRMGDDWTALHSITLGTQTATPWTNIAPRWGAGHYKASAITMLPNFISFPDNHNANFNDPAHPSWVNTSFLYEARHCPAFRTPDEDPIVDTSYDTTDEEEQFNCADIDSIAIDSVANAGDTALLNQIYSFLDSVGCDWHYANRPANQSSSDVPQHVIGVSKRVYDRSTKSNMTSFYTDKPRASPGSYATRAVELYPNPTNGRCYIEYQLLSPSYVSIGLTNALGQDFSSYVECASATQAVGKHKITVHSEHLNPGIYYCTILIQGTVVTKRVTVN